MIRSCSWGALGWNTDHEEWGAERESGRTVGCLVGDVDKGPAWALGTSDLEQGITLWEPWFLHLHNGMMLLVRLLCGWKGHVRGRCPSHC